MCVNGYYNISGSRGSTALAAKRSNFEGISWFQIDSFREVCVMKSMRRPVSSHFFCMSPILFESNGVLPDGKYLPGQHRWSYPVRLTSALLTCQPPTTGILTLSLEVGGALTGVDFTVSASALLEV